MNHGIRLKYAQQSVQAMMKYSTDELEISEEAALETFQVWVDAVLSALGPTAKAGPIKSSAYKVLEDEPNYFGIDCVVSDPRLPGLEKTLTLRWTKYQVDVVTVSVNADLGDSRWVKNMIKSMTGSSYLRTASDGDLTTVVREAKPKVKELMDVLNPIIMMEGQRRRSSKTFDKAFDLVKDKIKDALDDLGMDAREVLGGIQGGQANVNDDGAPYAVANLTIKGLLHEEDTEDADWVRNIASVVRTEITAVLSRFSREGDVVAKMSPNSNWSALTYGTNIIFYFKNGPVPKVKFGSSDVLAAHQPNLIQMAYSRFELRPYSITAATKNE